MGPVERALLSLDPALDNLTVEPAKPILGDFRIDLRPLLGDAASEKPACREIANRLLELEDIEKATAIPPRIYVRPSQSFLYRKVVSCVLADPGRYGASNEGIGKRAIVTFSDPNANKSLHLGHLRNNFLGMALGQLFEFAGYEVERHTTISDWGIHICQSLLAYMKWGAGRTPEQELVKGDEFVGRFYVQFHRENNPAPTALEAEAVEVLRLMDSGDKELIGLSETLTHWAEEGIGATYSRIGSRFEHTFREASYLSIAREAIEQALQGGLCKRRADGSAYVDLEDLGMGEITLIRGDGSTTVYSQIMGIDISRFDRPVDKVLSIFGYEWEAGATAYREMMQRFGYRWVKKYEPVFYGMITMPNGSMSSREGNALAADELLDHLKQVAKSFGDLGMGAEILESTSEQMVLGLLKYYLLRVGRNHTLPYSEALLWQNMLRRFISITNLTAEVAEPSRSHRLSVHAREALPVSKQLHDLLLHINAFPRAVSRALGYREPAEIVRYMDGLCVKCEAFTRSNHLNPELAEVIEVVLDRCFWLLNITITPL